MHTMFVFVSCAAIVDWSDLDFSEEESDGLVIVILKEYVTRRHSSSLLALDATLSSWESRNHRNS